MATITLSNSNSKVVAVIAANDGFLNRIDALVMERALNYLDGTPTAAQANWSNGVQTGEFTRADLIRLSFAIVVQADPASASLADSLTDANIRATMAAVIDRHVAAWAAAHP